LKEKIASGSMEADADSFLATEVMSQISQQAHRLVHEQYWVLNGDLIPELEEKDVRFVRPTQRSPKAEAWLQDCFSHDLLPVLSPLGLDPAHPFPRILKEGRDPCLSNNSEAWVLQRDGEYKRCAPTGNQRVRRAQRSLLARIK
jgi:polyphosphate kinase